MGYRCRQALSRHQGTQPNRTTEQRTFAGSGTRTRTSERTKMFSKKRAIATMAFTAGAALVLAGCSGGGNDAAEPAATFDPDEEVTLDLAFWGNDIRADLYNQAIEAFNEEYPNITVNATFL